MLYYTIEGQYAHSDQRYGLKAMQTVC
jgi:hypothetical protein